VGTFMAFVYYIGPKGKYAMNKQNPVFWTKLFLITKDGPVTVILGKDKKNPAKIFTLDQHDYIIWFRFVMSFIINGFGFLLLLHVLPIQVSAQSSPVQMVFRVLGMIYLVDMDDCEGNTMTIVPTLLGEAAAIHNADFPDGIIEFETNKEDPDKKESCDNTKDKENV
jgi:hypothetical protein